MCNSGSSDDNSRESGNGFGAAADFRELANVQACYATVMWIDALPWRVYRKSLEPMVLPHMMKPVDRTKVRQAMKQAGALMARWVDMWDTQECRWWWVTCDNKDYDIENLPKRGRRDVRAGLRRCEVRRLEPTSQWLSEHGYAVYRNAYLGYGGEAPLSAEQYARDVLRGADYSGRESWGAFIGDKLIAYSRCLVQDNAVLLANAKSDPVHNKALPNNALTYTLTRHYLKERGFLYVTDGSRSVAHDTAFQSFVERMGYRKVYCPLRLELTPTLASLVRLKPHKWGKYLGLGKIAPGLLRKTDILSSLNAIANDCRHISANSP